MVVVVVVVVVGGGGGSGGGGFPQCVASALQSVVMPGRGGSMSCNEGVEPVKCRNVVAGEWLEWRLRISCRGRTSPKNQQLNRKITKTTNCLGR